ncbi:Enoyl-[acyl-carrier-protein] reductase [FMN] (EC, inferred for PFA pathway [Olavius algarvensis associated proteobacterium Delta 3]|nr:Enoyl-[acyl-carrier-protein] reductase [FMN] (EC, inferred for PFA pathway [Olavius algarvensis associated proteobacterium Delta 3]CAB5156461.1 Enoyl-[acyl-carrier-protein] reductase [FMN] (EC, inferred for PFA pathway [Olavius algarvensis associated proteobacterium Delta 3]
MAEKIAQKLPEPLHRTPECGSSIVSARPGYWIPGPEPPKKGPHALVQGIRDLNQPVSVIALDGQMGIGVGGTAILGEGASRQQHAESYPLIGYVPPLLPEDLGDPLFKSSHGVNYAYVAGAMANGITSVEMVNAVGNAGMIGFFGSAGLSIAEIEAAIHRLRKQMPDGPFGMNLIHSPFEPDLEQATVDLYLDRKIRLVSASAYLDMTHPLIQYRVTGIHRGADGDIHCPNRLVAKVSRHEVARKFFSPPPARLLRELVEAGKITEGEAALAETVPVAESMTAEADSGGHTDNRPALTLLPTLIALRDELSGRYNYRQPLSVGLGGGIATPESTAAAFAMGAAYVLTGTVNQACVEAGTSDRVRRMLAEARQAEVAMAPAADMFEMGVKVQVLKRGTMFPQRAAKLYDLYRACDGLEDIPSKERDILEKDYFRSSLEEAWHQTRRFFETRDPKQIIRAQQDPHHKMALVFRSYLGQSSNWANSGDPSRQLDYQIWCGPAIGAFNQWVKGSFLEQPENRKVVTVAMNLLIGACIVTRANWLRQQGVPLGADAGRFSPMPLDDITQMCTYSNLAN